jgi:ATP/maltotriose-dependent transcriptional regulator MalT
VVDEEGPIDLFAVTKTMQSRIEEHPDYESTLKNDPIAVLEAIKTLMPDPVRAQYPLVSMTDALSRLVNVKQQESESLLDSVFSAFQESNGLYDSE